MSKKTIKDLMDPINLTCDPDHSVFYWNEKSPNKVKNMNNQVIKVGDFVYFDGGKGKIEELIQVGVGPNDYYIAVLNGGKHRINAKACYPTRFDRFVANNGLVVIITSTATLLLMIYLIMNVIGSKI